MGLKGQSAVEYLTTYGWMILAVSAASAIAFNTMDRQCNEDLEGFYTESWEVNDFGFDIDDKFRISFSNNNPYNVTIKSMNFSLENKSKYKGFNEVIRPGDRKQFVVSGFLDSNSCNEMELEVVYDKGSLSNQSSFASVKSSHRIQ